MENLVIQMQVESIDPAAIVICGSDLHLEILHKIQVISFPNVARRLQAGPQQQLPL